jgi:hypothetical protein
VWGVDGEGKMYRVAEIYKTLMDIDWWAEQVARLDKTYDLRAVVCDPSQPGNIAKLNYRISQERGRSMPMVACKADNEVEAGLQHVRALMIGINGKPLLYLVRDALLMGRDVEMADKLKPCCTEEEIPSYVFCKIEEDKVTKRDKPDPRCDDHGCDALRYAAMFAFKRDLSHIEPKPLYDEGTMGHFWGHEEILGA